MRANLEKLTCLQGNKWVFGQVARGISADRTLCLVYLVTRFVSFPASLRLRHWYQWTLGVIVISILAMVTCAQSIGGREVAAQVKGDGGEGVKRYASQEEARANGKRAWACSTLATSYMLPSEDAMPTIMIEERVNKMRSRAFRI